MSNLQAAHIKEYSHAAAYLGTKRSCSLGYETHLLAHGDGTISIVHFATPIITYFPNGVTQINTGGYHTATTKRRVNLFTRAWVTQCAGLWEIRTADGWLPFVDGMCVDRNGMLTKYRDSYVPMVARDYGKRTGMCDDRFCSPCTADYTGCSCPCHSTKGA